MVVHSVRSFSGRACVYALLRVRWCVCGLPGSLTVVVWCCLRVLCRHEHTGKSFSLLSFMSSQVDAIPRFQALPNVTRSAGTQCGGYSWILSGLWTSLARLLGKAHNEQSTLI